MRLFCLKSSKKRLALLLILVLIISPVNAGILVTIANGITLIPGNGISYTGPSGIAITGADGLLAFQANGITAPTNSGIAITGADGATYTNPNGIVATGVDGTNITRADGIAITGADGIAITGADGRIYNADSAFIRQASGIAITGADNVTALGTNGIAITGADSRSIVSADGMTIAGANGIAITGADGIAITGADGQVFSISPNGIAITGADGIAVTGANGIAITGADTINAIGDALISLIGSGLSSLLHVEQLFASGVDRTDATNADVIMVSGLNGFTITGANGTTYPARSALIRQPNGIAITGADGVTAAGANGIAITGADSLTITNVNGLTATKPAGIAITGADGIAITGADGSVFSISPTGIAITGADGLIATNINGIAITGADTILASGIQESLPTGLQSLDPELAILLNQLTDDSNVNAAVVYHRLPTEAHLADLRQIGIMGGTRYHILPVILLTGTRAQIIQISRLPAVRAIYGNRTLSSLMEPGNGLTGTERAKTDTDLTSRNGGVPLTGRGVTVAVLDTGIDSQHTDLAGRVVRSVKLASTLGAGGGFNYPIYQDLLPTTDPINGHGTFVGGVVAGSGTRSGGKYKGVAPGARLLGLSAGELSLFNVLEGFDYLLVNGPETGARVVNCSFSANTVYDVHDPVNVATKLLTERGISVVFSAGNSGPGLLTLNPYAMAPWVISVGATDQRGRVAGFSSRGDFTTPNARPTIIAPGVNVVSLRAAGLNINGTLNAVLGTDLSVLLPSELPYYTVGSGTSFSAPQVAGTIALMLEANPALTPTQIRDILQRSATPLPPYYQYEVGAGMLNAHAAVLEAAFPQRRMGVFRASLDRGQARFVNDPVLQFSGTVPAMGGTYTTSLPVPQNSLHASVQIAWGPLSSVNDLALQLTAPNGAARPELNQLNLPGLTGRFERDLVSMPAAGNWTVRLRNTLGLLGLTSQPFFGALEVTRAEYPQMNDLGDLSSTARDEVFQNLRSFVMGPLGRNFRPQFSVSRFELAGALVLGGRVPQYIAGQPRYTDVVDKSSRLIVESVQAAPVGALFPDASPGGQFRPDDRVNRLTTAIALVRAAGLQSEAEAQMNASLPVSDASSIPAQWRGHVAVALSRGLLTPDGGAFRPSQALKRIELVHAMATLARLAIE